MSAALNPLYVVLFKVINEGGVVDNVVLLLVSRLWDAGLAKRVQTPGPDLATLFDGEGVVVTTADMLDDLSLKAKFTRHESSGSRPRDNATGKLMLLSGSPVEGAALGVDGKYVVRSGSDHLNLLQLWDQSWCLLNMRAGPEAQNSIISLWKLI